MFMKVPIVNKITINKDKNLGVMEKTVKLGSTYVNPSFSLS